MGHNTRFAFNNQHRFLIFSIYVNLFFAPRTISTQKTYFEIGVIKNPVPHKIEQTPDTILK